MELSDKSAHQVQSGIVSPSSCEITRRREHPLGSVRSHIAIDGFVWPAQADECITGFCVARRAARSIIKFYDCRLRIQGQKSAPSILVHHPPVRL